MKPKKSDQKEVGLIRLLCTCGKRVKVSPEFAGKVGKCPKCGNPVQIPPLEVIEKKMHEMKGKEEGNDIFEFPSLPELKQLSLGGEEDSQAGEKKRPVLQLGTPDVLETTGDLEAYFHDDGNIAVPQPIEIPPPVKTIPGIGTSKSKQIPLKQEKAVQQQSFLDENLFEPLEEKSKKEESMFFENIQEQPDFGDLYQKDDPDVPQPISMEEPENFADAVSMEEPENFADAVSMEEPENFANAVSIEEPENFANAVSMEEIEEEFVQAITIDQTAENLSMAEAIFVDEGNNIVEALEIVESISSESQAQEFQEEDFIKEEQVDAMEAEFIEEISAEEAIEAEMHTSSETEKAQYAIEEIEEIQETEWNSSPKEKQSPKKEFKVNLDINLKEEMPGCENLLLGKAALENSNFEEAMHHLSVCISTGEDAGAAYYLRAVLYIKKKIWQLAIEDLENAKEFGYDEIGLEDLLNQVYFQMATEYRNIGAYGEALNYLDKIVGCNIASEKGKVYWMRARYLIRVGALEASLRDLEEAILNEYLKPEVFETRGKIYLELRDYESAMHNFSYSISRGGKNAELFKGRSEAYFFLKDFDAALSDIQYAQQISPDDACLYDLEGLILNEKNMHQEADIAFEKSLGLDPNNSLHYFNRALCYMRRGRYDRSIEDLTRVIQSNPKDQFAHLKRAICYQEKSNPNLALARQDVKKVEELDQSSLYRSHKTNLGKEIL
ncbi:MAG: tetratricopeptide repeat protein [Candidatus Brocadiae bacterium]|nr:tetratricopeptide repeat protein [Candidatus Brocadiia bacterium]